VRRRGAFDQKDTAGDVRQLGTGNELLADHSRTRHFYERRSLKDARLGAKPENQSRYFDPTLICPRAHFFHEMVDRGSHGEHFIGVESFVVYRRLRCTGGSSAVSLSRRMPRGGNSSAMKPRTQRRSRRINLSGAPAAANLRQQDARDVFARFRVSHAKGEAVALPFTEFVDADVTALGRVIQP
jgi:hypothetical protein